LLHNTDSGDEDVPPQWAAAGYRPQLVDASIVAVAAAMLAGGIGNISFPILDPDTNALPIDQYGNILPGGAPPGTTLQWITDSFLGVGSVPGIVDAMDLNIGLHPESTFTQQAAAITGSFSLQLHVTTNGANIADWIAEGLSYNPRRLELHPDQAATLPPLPPPQPDGLPNPTANDIITDALSSIGVYSPGSALSASDARICLHKLNDMLDSWSNEPLAVYANQSQTFSLLAGVAAYTIGPTGVWQGTRPLMLDASDGACVLTDQNGDQTYPRVIEQDEWNRTGNKLIGTSDIPTVLFYDAQYPNGIINLYPTPTDGSYTLTFQARLQLKDFATLQANMYLPPGYKDALQTNLALEIWEIYKPNGSEPPPLLMERARRAKGKIKRSNLRANPASFDAAVNPLRNYDIYSDSGRSA
jgi:hypothetical protein